MKRLWMFALVLLIGVALTACDNGGEEPVEEPHISLDREYAGMNFFTDGIQEVELHQCIDGDTTQFRFNGRVESIRYLLIDTPESTSEFEPWGKAASDYVCERLTNANTIVIEAERPGDTGTHGRYLGYVWVDGELLQLDLVRQGYARVGGDGRYRNVLQQAQALAINEGLKRWGEDDPLFATVYEIESLAYLLNNYDEYKYRPINITLTVVSHSSGRVVLTDDSTTQTIVLYYGNLQSSIRIQEPGNVLRFTELHPTFNPFRPTERQLVNFSRHRVTCIEGPCEVYDN